MCAERRVPLKIRAAKRRKNLTWRQIAAEVSDASIILTTAALFGQMR
jgi:hypothetical protein